MENEAFYHYLSSAYPATRAAKSEAKKYIPFSIIDKKNFLSYRNIVSKNLDAWPLMSVVRSNFETFRILC